MKVHKLNAEKREVTGKKVKHLRKKGVVPANIYGKTVKSLAIQVPLADFQKTYEEVGETGLVELTVAGLKEPRHVLVHNVQIHPISDDFLHIDFHEVALKEKIRVPVPLTLIGESPVTNQKTGVLLHILDEVEVEALPTDLPEEINVDISTLAEIGDEIKVSDLKVDTSKITVITEGDRTIVKINPLEKEEAPAPVAAPAEGAVSDAVKEGEVAPETKGESKEAPKEAKPTEEKAPEKKEEKK